MKSCLRLRVSHGKTAWYRYIIHIVLSVLQETSKRKEMRRNTKIFDSTSGIWIIYVLSQTDTHFQMELKETSENLAHFIAKMYKIQVSCLEKKRVITFQMIKPQFRFSIFCSFFSLKYSFLAIFCFKNTLFQYICMIFTALKHLGSLIVYKQYVHKKTEETSLYL